MSEEVYEVVAQAARYWFLFLMALIVWRSYRWFVRDRRQRKKRLRLLPDAGYVGELVVLSGGGELTAGAALPVACEGVLGSVRGSDVCVPVRGVAKKHCWFTFDPDDGLYVEPFSRNTIEVDGEPVRGFRQHACLSHGSRLVVGDATLRLRLFAGFEGAGEARADARAFADEPDEQAPQSAPALTPEQMQALLLQQAQWMAMLRQSQAQGCAEPNATEPPQGVPAYPQGTSANPPGTYPQGVSANPQGMPAYPQSTPTAPAPGHPADASLAPDALADPTAAYRRPVGMKPPTDPEVAPAIDEAAEREADAFYARQAEAAAAWDSSIQFVGGAAADGDNPTFAPGTTFYPPVMDDDPDGADEPDGANLPEAWDYAPYPQSDATFADEGYTYPVYVEEPDKSLYVEPDEAERAKKLVWDKYLKGGRR